MVALGCLLMIGGAALSLAKPVTPELLIVLLIVQQIAIVLPFYVVMKKDDRPVREQILLHGLSGRQVFMTLLVALGIREVMTMIDILSRIFAPGGTEAVGEIIKDFPLPVALFVVAVLPAVGEEFVYRGAIFGTYKRASRQKAVLLSSLMFALVHMNLNQFSYTFVMGIAMALLMEKTDSILSTMLVHAINNGAAVITGDLPQSAQKLLMPQSVTEMLIRGCIGAAVVVAALKGLKGAPEPPEKEGVSLMSKMLVAAIILLSAVIIGSL